MSKRYSEIVNIYIVYEWPLRHGQEDLDAQTELSFVVISLHPSSLTDAAYAHWNQNHSHFAFYYMQFLLDWPETKYIQVNNYEIVVNFFHISHTLTWYSAIVHRFVRIYQFVQLMNWQNNSCKFVRKFAPLTSKRITCINKETVKWS